MKFFTIIIVFLLLGITNVSGQIGPYAMVERMDRGINLGNTLSAPIEGNWAPEIYEQYFVDIKNAGFMNVRIPMDFYGIEQPELQLNILLLLILLMIILEQLMITL